jgi:DHA1 family inner membrane transport protein
MTRPASGTRAWAAFASGGFGLSISAMFGLLVPLRASEVGVSFGLIGLIVAARSLTESLLAVQQSRVIARVGTRGGFVISTATCAAVAALFIFAEGFWALLLLNVAMGAGRSLGWVASQAYISSFGAPADRGRNTGRFSFASNLSQVVTPLMVGTSAATIGYRFSFLVVAAYCLLFTLIALLLSPTRDDDHEEPVHMADAIRLFGIRRLQIAMLLTFVRLWVPNIWTPLFPLLLVADGFSPTLAAAVISSSSLVATAVNLFTGRLTRLASPEVLCTAALSVTTIGLIASPHLMAMPVVFLVPLMTGVGSGLSLPLLIMLVSEAAPPGQRSLALATRNAVNSMSAAIGPVGTAPMVAALGAVSAFAVAGGVSAALLVAAVALQRSTAGSRRAERTPPTAPVEAPAGGADPARPSNLATDQGGDAS